MTPVADTGLLVGFLDTSDQYHGWAEKCFGTLRGPLTTCEAVLAEAEHLVPGAGPLLMEMAHQGSLRIVPMVPAESDRLGALMKHYPKMQFADACVVRLSEMLPDAVIYTTDKRDFKIYRRNGRESISRVTP